MIPSGYLADTHWELNDVKTLTEKNSSWGSVGISWYPPGIAREPKKKKTDGRREGGISENEVKKVKNKIK
jgi:hypothetical protein